MGLDEAAMIDPVAPEIYTGEELEPDEKLMRSIEEQIGISENAKKAFREEIPDTTKIIIAQRISSVEHADKIIVMENGMIDAIGTHQELLASNAIYKEVYTSQMKGGLGDE